jgi:hypothetical protein
MGRYHPTETIITELRAAGIKPSEVRQGKIGHKKIYFTFKVVIPVYLVSV